MFSKTYWFLYVNFWNYSSFLEFNKYSSGQNIFELYNVLKEVQFPTSETKRDI